MSSTKGDATQGQLMASGEQTKKVLPIQGSKNIAGFLIHRLAKTKNHMLL
jgi:hypothetical protein